MYEKLMIYWIHIWKMLFRWGMLYISLCSINLVFTWYFFHHVFMCDNLQPSICFNVTPCFMVIQPDMWCNDLFKYFWYESEDNNSLTGNPIKIISYLIWISYWKHRVHWKKKLFISERDNWMSETSKVDKTQQVWWNNFSGGV